MTSWNIGTASMRHPDWKGDYCCATEADAVVAAKRDAAVATHLVQQGKEGKVLRATFDSEKEALSGTAVSPSGGSVHHARTFGHLPPGAFLAENTTLLRVCGATDLAEQPLLLFPLHLVGGIVRVDPNCNGTETAWEPAEWEALVGPEKLPAWREKCVFSSPTPKQGRKIEYVNSLGLKTLVRLACAQERTQLAKKHPTAKDTPKEAMAAMQARTAAIDRVLEDAAALRLLAPMGVSAAVTRDSQGKQNLVAPGPDVDDSSLPLLVDAKDAKAGAGAVRGSSAADIADALAAATAAVTSAAVSGGDYLAQAEAAATPSMSLYGVAAASAEGAGASPQSARGECAPPEGTGEEPRSLKERRLQRFREAEQNDRSAQLAFAQAVSRPRPGQGPGVSAMGSAFPVSCCMVDECGRVQVLLQHAAEPNLAGYEGVDDGWSGGVWRRGAGDYDLNL